MSAERPDRAPVEPTDSQSSTKTLVRRTRLGDSGAANRLFARLVVRVRRWARGRLPSGARDLSDTVDVVQDAVAGIWGRLDRVAIEAPGDLEAYLRQAVRNRIRDEARRVRRRPTPLSLDSALPDNAPSPLARAIGGQLSARYQEAFAQLSEDEREALVARYEFGYSYQEMAVLLGRPSAAAARMAVTRAVERVKHLIGANAAS